MAETVGKAQGFKGTPADLRFGSNAVRLSPREWQIVGAIFLAYILLAPSVWERWESFRPEPDFRVPYDLSNDYWVFSRWSRSPDTRSATLVVGDSVIWGQYVTKEQTFTHYLNELNGQPRFANLGVDGMHPVALAGLLKYYGAAISGRTVLLHCNLLWTGSDKHDLQAEKVFSFNHPTLVPQFRPNIRCYGETYSKRLGVAIERNVPFYPWTAHLRLEYLDKMDLPTWTLENPSSVPFGNARWEIPQPDARLRHEPIPWTRRGIARQDFAWVELEASLQWRFFRQAVRILQRRGNRVFVLVGPFNEHMLTDDSRKVYQKNKHTVEAWLKKEEIPFFAPVPLPSEQYADASHPLSEGYAQLARLLVEDASFAAFDVPFPPRAPTGQ